MRIWLHLGLVLISCCFIAYRPLVTQPEGEIQRKAQSLADAYYGPGHAQITVTLRQGRGERNICDTL